MRVSVWSDTLDFAGMAALRTILGHAIRAARESRDWSLERLADSVTKRRRGDAKAVTVDTISRLERGLTNFKIDTLEEYVQTLDLPLFQFFEIAEKLAANQPVTFPAPPVGLDLHSLDELVERSMERADMKDKTALQWDLIRLAAAVQPEDALAAYEALAAVYARRGLHQGNASGSGET